jgi:hypothetical protein
MSISTNDSQILAKKILRLDIYSRVVSHGKQNESESEPISTTRHEKVGKREMEDVIDSILSVHQKSLFG